LGVVGPPGLQGVVVIPLSHPSIRNLMQSSEAAPNISRTWSADCLKYHLGTTPAVPAMPPARGWPKEPAGHAGVSPVFPASPPPPAP
jgi:hypothetical protein